MNKYLLFLPLLLLLICCKSKKGSLQDDEEITAEEFIEFFPEQTLPLRVADTSFRKPADSSLLIGRKVFTRFIPDSILQQDFGKNARPVISAIGRVTEKGKETYLLAKAVAGSKRVAYLATFDRKQQFLRAMPLVKSGFPNIASAYGVLDGKFQITTYQERKGSSPNYKKNVYFYNTDAKEFTLIFTEPNEEMIDHVINPIDTLSKKGKFTGDYVKDKMNFVSVRDGSKPGQVLLFIHFERDGGNCKGELKGTARFISANVAQYYQNGNPCTIELHFTASRVLLKETAGCGTYRGIKCFFEGTYPKKKSR